MEEEYIEIKVKDGIIKIEKKIIIMLNNTTNFDNIDSNVMYKIIEYIKIYYKFQASEISNTQFNVLSNKWYSEYLSNLTLDECCDLANFSDYLKIEKLRALIDCAICNHINLKLLNKEINSKEKINYT